MDSNLDNLSPLTKTRRRIIFYLIAFLFALIVPVTILYSIGYRFDIKTHELVSTGGIFIKTNQTGFSVFINGKLAKQTGFLSRGALITELKPDLYIVRIEKDGFKPWQKFVHVQGENVSEYRFVMLNPEKIAEKEILDFARRGLTINTVNILDGSPWLVIRVKERGRFVYLFNSKTNILGAVETFDKSKWDAANHRLLVMRKNPLRWSVVNLGADKIHEEKIILPKEIKTVIDMDFSYENPNEFLILNSDGKLWRFDKITGITSQLLADISAFGVKNARIWYVGRDGFYYSTDLNGENGENYGRKGYYISESSPIVFGVSPSGDNFMLDSGGGLFVRKAGDNEATPVSGNVKNAVFDRSGEKLIFCTNHDINVIWLKDEEHQPFRKASTREKIITLAEEEINTCDWWGPDEENIIFSAGKFVGVTDIDNRGGGVQTQILYDNISDGVDFNKEKGWIVRSEKGFLFSSNLY